MKAPLLEPVADLRPAVVVGGGGEMVQRLGDAAELDGEDLLHVLFGLGGRPFIRPRRHAFQHLKRLLVAGQADTCRTCRP